MYNKIKHYFLKIKLYYKKCVFVAKISISYIQTRGLRKSEYDLLVWVVRPFQETFIASMLEELSGEYNVAILRSTGRETADGVWGEGLPGVKTFQVSPWQLKRWNCKVFLSPETAKDKSRLPRARHYVHVPHSPVSLHMIYPDGNFAAFDILMAVGEHHVEEFPRLKGVDAHVKSFPVGYGRMDVMRCEYQEFCKSRTHREKPLVVIAPSWHEGNILEVVGPQLTNALLEAGFSVIFRPHYKIAELKPDFIQRLQNSFGHDPDFELIIAGQDNIHLYRADVLISDYSGVALEYAYLTERPVVFIDIPPKVRNPNWEQVGLEPIELAIRDKIGLIVPVDPEQIVMAARSLLGQQEHFRTRIRAARDRYCFHFEASAGLAAAGYLEQLLNDCRDGA